jgi:hypothetical protein
MKISIFGSSSRGLLIRLMVAHVLGTLFAYTVYVSFTSLGDGYNPESFAGVRSAYGDGFSSTVIVWAFYTVLGSVFTGFLAPMFLGLVVAVLTWHAFRDIYAHSNLKIFWACNLLPHFLVWSGSSSKEQIVIIAGIIVINFAAKRSFANSKLTIKIIFVIFALWVLFLIRPNYAAIYLVIFLTALFSPWLHKIITKRLSVGVYVFAWILAIIGVTFVLSLHETFFSEDVVRFMLQIQHSFLAYVDSGSNRTDIQWNDISDFMYNSLWAIPQGFIGPTLFELISKPIQIPAFLEGVVHLSILGYLLVKLLQLARVSSTLRIHILPYIFVGFVIIFISYPYLMFNPGSALRYKQAMHPILIFYPLLILAYNSRGNYLTKTNTKNMPYER